MSQQHSNFYQARPEVQQQNSQEQQMYQKYKNYEGLFSDDEETVQTKQNPQVTQGANANQVSVPYHYHQQQQQYHPQYHHLHQAHQYGQPNYHQQQYGQPPSQQFLPSYGNNQPNHNQPQYYGQPYHQGQGIHQAPSLHQKALGSGTFPAQTTSYQQPNQAAVITHSANTQHQQPPISNSNPQLAALQSYYNQSFYDSKTTNQAPVASILNQGQNQLQRNPNLDRPPYQGGQSQNPNQNFSQKQHYIDQRPESYQQQNHERQVRQQNSSRSQDRDERSRSDSNRRNDDRGGAAKQHQRQSFQDYQRNQNKREGGQSQRDNHSQKSNNNFPQRQQDNRDSSSQKRALDIRQNLNRSRSRSNDRNNKQKPQTVLKNTFERQRQEANEQLSSRPPIKQNIIPQIRSASKSDFTFGSSNPSKLAEKLRSQLQNGGKKIYEKEDFDYIRQICKKAQNLKADREQQERDERRNQRKLEESKQKTLLQTSSLNSLQKLNQQKPVDQRVLEAKVVAEYFYLLNETNWNKFDDVFYVMNRRWFDRWKDYICYDYIVRFLIEQGRKESELSINKILSNNSSPGEISNQMLLMDKKDFLTNKSQAPEKTYYLNAPLKPGLIPEKDFFLVSENIWKFLHQRYKGEEIKRYAIYKNQAGILERQPYLPTLSVCLVLRDEAIRPPKWMTLPRKSTYEQAKWIIKDVFPWLKDYLDDEIRFWRLHPELRDIDFIDQYNQQLSQKVLPKVMKFPGFSLEKSLKFFIEEYQTFDRFRETLFVEVRKVSTLSLFELDFKDNRNFDEGAFNLDKHLSIYSFANYQEQWQNVYNTFFKFHNNTTRDYFDVKCPSLKELYAPFLKNLFSEKELQSFFATGFVKQVELSLNEPVKIKQTKDKSTSKGQKSQQQNQNAKAIANQQGEDKKKDLPNSKKTNQSNLNSNKVDQQNATSTSDQTRTCTNCNEENLERNMTACQTCKATLYCGQNCLTADSRFHQIDCKRLTSQQILSPSVNKEQAVERQLSQTQTTGTVEVVSDEEKQVKKSKQAETYNQNVSVHFSQDSGSSNSKGDHDSSSEDSDSSSNSDAFSGSSSEDEKKTKIVRSKDKKSLKAKKPQNIVEIDKNRLVFSEDEREQRTNDSKPESILKFDSSNLPSKDQGKAPSLIGKRKKSMDSNYEPGLTSDVESQNLKRMKNELVPVSSSLPSEHSRLALKSQSSQDISIQSLQSQFSQPFQQYQQAAPTGLSQTQSSINNPFKLDNFKEKPFLQPRAIQTQDEAGSKLASLLVLLTQLPDLKDHLTIEQGPLNAIILDVLNRLTDQSQIGNHFMLPFNKLERHIDLKQKDLLGIFNQMLQKLASTNQSLLQNFLVRQKFNQICLNCGEKESREFDEHFLELQNESDDNHQKFSVKIKVMYIFDSDKFKKYEVQLKPGEYTYHEMIGKIKEKLQVDHPILKSGKKSFVLVDLHFENTMFGQMFSNENMKFNFRQDQQLTTFAYEINKSWKDKIKGYHFVHVAKADQESRITYQVFPRLVMFQEAEQVRLISQKVFKGLRSTLSNTIYQTDPLFMQQSEQEAFNQVFQQVENAQEPYEMVIVLKDNSRWKLDPYQKQKLTQIVDVDLIMRFEVIFPVIASFVEMKTEIKNEVAKVISPERELGFRELQACLRKYIRQTILPSQKQILDCKKCKERKGTQQVTELIKIGNNLVIRLKKVDQSQAMEYPLKLMLDKYISKSSQHNQGNNYELIGGISITDSNSCNYQTSVQHKTEIQTEALNKEETKSEAIQSQPNRTVQAKSEQIGEQPAQKKYSSLVYNSKQGVWTNYLFGLEPTFSVVQPVILEDKDKEQPSQILLDKSMDFLIYRKLKGDRNQELGGGGATNQGFGKQFSKKI